MSLCHISECLVLVNLCLVPINIPMLLDILYLVVPSCTLLASSPSFTISMFTLVDNVLCAAVVSVFNLHMALTQPYY